MALLAVFWMMCFYLVTTAWILTSAYYVIILSINQGMSFDIEQRCCVFLRMIVFAKVK